MDAGAEWGGYDAEVLAALHEQHYDRVVRHIVAKTGNRDPLQDMASEVSLRAVESFPSYPDRGLLIDLGSLESGMVLGSTRYGLWLVETDSGEVTGLDATARPLRSLECFHLFSSPHHGFLRRLTWTSGHRYRRCAPSTA